VSMAGEFKPTFGYDASPAGTAAFVSSLPRPTLDEAGAFLMASPREVFLGEFLLRLDPGWKRLSQPIGSCVGWGWSLAVQMLAACDICVRNEREGYGGRVLEAATYGFSRVEARGLDSNYGGDGSYGAAAAKAVTKYGTLYADRDYNGHTYKSADAKLERGWGRDGVPDFLEPFAAERRVLEAVLVRNFTDVVKAVSNGYPVAICSTRAFHMKFTADAGGRGGWLKPNPADRWPHCQMISGCFASGPRPWARVENSWGDCYSGPVDERVPAAFQRCGGKVDADEIDRMIGGSDSDSFAIAGYSGFAPSQLSDWTGGVFR
jgi:hypothetical protein